MSIKYANRQIVTAGDLSADITSLYVPIEYNFGVGMQAVWTGTSPVGVLKIQGTCDDTDAGRADAADLNWTDLSGTNYALSGNAGSFIYQLNDLTLSAVRLFYDFTSGTGTLNVVSVTKGV